MLFPGVASCVHVSHSSHHAAQEEIRAEIWKKAERKVWTVVEEGDVGIFKVRLL